jgi:hypothetical protein
MFSFDNNTKEVNTKSDSNVGTATSDIIGGKSSTWDGIDVPTKFRLPATFLQITATAKRRKKRVMIGKLDEWYSKGLIKKQFAVHVGFQL